MQLQLLHTFCAIYEWLESQWSVSLVETESWYSTGVTTSTFFWKIIKKKPCHLQLRLEFQQFFSHIMEVSCCDRERNAHFYSAASLKYHAPDTWYDTTPSHINLTLERPVLACPINQSAKRGAASTIFNDFGMSQPGMEPMTSRSPDTLPTELFGPVSGKDSSHN